MRQRVLRLLHRPTGGVRAIAMPTTMSLRDRWRSWLAIRQVVSVPIEQWVDALIAASENG
jgi:hypothetical protein